MPRDPELSPPPPTVPTELRAAPPTAPGSMSLTKPVKWPTVLGVISITFGGLGLLGVLMNIISYVFDWGELESITRAQEAIWTVVTVVVDASLSVFLIWSGIRLLKRNPKAPALFQLWTISFGTTMIIYSGMTFIVTMNEMQSEFGTPSAPSTSAFVVAGIFSLLLLIFGAIPITFFVIWFRRTAVREEIATWATLRAPQESAA